MSKSFDLNQYWSDSAAILVRMKRFKKETIKFRRLLGIPINGFPQEQGLLWYKSLFDQPNINTEKRFSFEASRVFLPPNKFVIETIEKFASKFNLDERWYIDLLSYLFRNDGILNVPFGDIDIDVGFNNPKLPDDKRVVTHLSIEISNDTTLKDIERIWGVVQEYQSKMRTNAPKRRRQLINTRTYIRIRNLEDQGISQSKIIKMLPEIKHWDATDVANFKKEIESRFKPKNRDIMPH